VGCRSRPLERGMANMGVWSSNGNSCLAKQDSCTTGKIPRVVDRAYA
jgi:hypothetical protein